MTHQYSVSTAAAARLILMAARISGILVALVADVVEGRRDVDSCPWGEFGAEGLALEAALRVALRRSQRARQAAVTRSKSAKDKAEGPKDPSAKIEMTGKTTPTPVVVDPPFEMRRTSRGMEKFYRWPDRSWRRIPPTPGACTKRRRLSRR